MPDSQVKSEVGVDRDNGKAKGYCSLCAYWSPHIFYPVIGFCRAHGTMTFEDYSCSLFKRVTYSDGSLYWCLTCRTRLSGDEARRHAAMGHRVYVSGYIDPDVREELYDAF